MGLLAEGVCQSDLGIDLITFFGFGELWRLGPNRSRPVKSQQDRGHTGVILSGNCLADISDIAVHHGIGESGNRESYQPTSK